LTLFIQISCSIIFLGIILLKLSWALTKVTTSRNFQPWHGISIGSILPNCVTPPIEGDALITQGKEYDNRGERSAGIHSGLEEIYTEQIVSADSGIDMVMRS